MTNLKIFNKVNDNLFKIRTPAPYTIIIGFDV